MSERAKGAAQRAMRRAGIVFVGVLLVLGAVVASTARRNSGAAQRVAAPDVTDTSSQRIRVQVLNATTTRGLARRATMHLRDRGFDVVETGTSATQLDSTVVLDRSGHPDWARRVAEALGGARVEARPDSSRYLDVTVLLGRTWRPPTEPFYP